MALGFLILMRRWEARRDRRRARRSAAGRARGQTEVYRLEREGTAPRLEVEQREKSFTEELRDDR